MFSVALSCQKLGPIECTEPLLDHRHHAGQQHVGDDTACETGVAARLGVAAPAAVITLAPLLRELALNPLNRAGSIRYCLEPSSGTYAVRPPAAAVAS